MAECTARSHLSILPPRSLVATPEEAERHVQHLARHTQPFVISLGGVCVFEKTSVIYVEVQSGQVQLESLHSRSSSGALAFDEPYPFHPHVTLAQNFGVDQLAERRQLTEARWADYRGPREFLLDRVVFVQNTLTNCWLDLRSFPLQAMPGAPVVPSFPQLSQTC